jgi:hypothetical protein
MTPSCSAPKAHPNGNETYFLHSVLLLVLQKKGSNKALKIPEKWNRISQRNYQYQSRASRLLASKKPDSFPAYPESL